PALPLLVCASLAIGAMAVVRFHAEQRLSTVNPAAAADRVIPPGACVLTDDAAYTLIAGRFRSSHPRCSKMVDAIGTDLALAHGHNALAGAGADPAVRAVW